MPVPILEGQVELVCGNQSSIALCVMLGAIDKTWSTRAHYIDGEVTLQLGNVLFAPAGRGTMAGEDEGTILLCL